jgi:hypothetical protein
MPKHRKSDQVRCRYFTWRLKRRGTFWYADGRSNTPSPGRHSIGTVDKDEALTLLVELDRARAEELGLAPRSEKLSSIAKPLGLVDGRKLYETHIGRPRITGGVRASTAKRYRTTFDKFVCFALAKGVMVWNAVTADTLTDYAAHLHVIGRLKRDHLWALPGAVREWDG